MKKKKNKKVTSFKQMTPRQRAAANKKMLAVEITGEEITFHDPMIFMIIKNVILNYWRNGTARVRNNDSDVLIGRLGLTLDDLMQYGRMFVCQQIRWYKVFGDPSKSKLSTCLYRYLNYKFLNLSRVASNQKHGGAVVNVKKERAALQVFLDNYDGNKSIKRNIVIFRGIVSKLSKTLQKRCNKDFKSNADLTKFVYNMMVKMNLVVFQNYDDFASFAIADSSLNPEESLMAKEGVLNRMHGMLDKNSRTASHLEDKYNLPFKAMENGEL